MVDLIGIEPMTSSMPWKRAPSCATGPHERDATVLLSPLGRDSSIGRGPFGMHVASSSLRGDEIPGSAVNWEYTIGGKAMEAASNRQEKGRRIVFTV